MIAVLFGLAGGVIMNPQWYQTNYYLRQLTKQQR